MFLKRFKAKSNQKFISALLDNRKNSINEKKIETIALLLNDDEFDKRSVFEDFFEELSLQSFDQQFFTFSKKGLEIQIENETTFTPDDFGWSGKLKKTDLQNFTNSKFDVLICYFLHNEPELVQIAAMSNANFKVGISMADDRLYDLIIDVKPNDFKRFKTELKKYLTILNKI
jgi:hypothetical protein